MAAGSAISLEIGVNGEKTFNSALESINAQLKSLATGVKATDAEMKAMGESAELTAQKNEQLETRLGLLDKELAIVQEKFDAASDTLDEYAQAMEDAQASGDETEIDRATNAYNKQAAEVANLSNRLNGIQKDISNTSAALVEGEKNSSLFAQAIEKIKSASESLSQKLQPVQTVLGGIGSVVGTVASGVAAMGQAFAGAVSAVTNLTKEAGQYADTILTVAEQSGIDPIDLQKWEYASQFIDTEVTVITGSMRRLTQGMTDEGSSAGEALTQLGVKMTDASGHMRDSETVFWEAIDALGKISNETERDQLAMQMFGRSAQELNPLINAGSAAFKQLGDEAEQMGIILDGEALSSLGSVDDAMNKLQSTITGAGRQIAAAFAPAVGQITNDVQGVVQAFIGMVKGVEGSEEQMKQAISKLVDDAASTLKGILPIVLDVGIDLIMTLADAILDNLDEIIDAALELILALVDGLIDNIDKLVEAALKLIIGLAEGLIKALPRLVEKAPEIIRAVCDALVDGIKMLWDVGKQWIDGIWQGIKEAKDKFLENILGFFGNVMGKIQKFFGIGSPSRVFANEVGKPIVQGVALGITQNLGILEDAYEQMMPDSGMFAAAADGLSVAARVAGESGGSAPWQDTRPIILQLNDRELGRAVRGYV